jgi:hypothetical protein
VTIFNILNKIGIRLSFCFVLKKINIFNLGFSWLYTIAKGQKIKFLPISRDNKFLTCIVMIPEKNKVIHPWNNIF